MGNDNNPRLRDKLTITDSFDRLSRALKRRGKDIVRVASALRGGEQRTELSQALADLNNRSGKELIRLSKHPEDAEHAARAVRNIFEVNLIVRFVIDSEENLTQWVTSRVKEEIDLLQGILHFRRDAQDQQHIAQLESDILRLKQYLTDRGYSLPKRLPRWDVLARDYGVETEYRALYGAYSKYVHPTAWTIVKPNMQWDPIFTQIFIVHSQLYAGDTAGRSGEATGIDVDRYMSSWREGV